MTNLFMDLITPTPELDNHLYGIYFSLDDSKNEIFSRIIAMQQSIPIGVIKKPQTYKDQEAEIAEYSTYLQKRQAGYQQLIQQTSRLIIGDLTDTFAYNEEAMYAFIKKCKQDVQQIDSQGNILIAIDAIDDIRLKNSEDDKMTYLASTLKRWSIDLDIIVFCSKHLKKLGANRRPCLDDLRDSNELVYEASAVLLVYNDVGKNKGAAKVYYEKEGEMEKQPVMELNWAKNKKSSFKGLTFYHFIPDFSLLLECSPEDAKYYQNVIYSL